MLPPGIVLACTLRREDARDALILGPGCGAPDPAAPFAALPGGAVVGTSSVRRQAQICTPGRISGSRRCAATSRPGWTRWPPETCDASLLALAGLQRLGLDTGRRSCWIRT